MKSIRLRDWEVRAIQAGATQIRRLVKSRYSWEVDNCGPNEQLWPFYPDYVHGGELVGEDALLQSPFGQPGDVLLHKATGLELVTKAVRVERVQEISEADAVACGIFKWHGLDFYGYDRKGTPGLHCCDTATQTYASLFRSIHGPDAWDRNDYVWVGEFERKAVGNE